MQRLLKNFMPVAFLFAAQGALAHGAHEHGTANIEIAADDNTAKIHFEVPTVSVYGFEHEAKNENDKKLVNSAIEKIKANIGQMVKLDSSLGCKFSTTKIEPFIKDDDDEGAESEVKNSKDQKNKNDKKEEGEHGNFHAEFKVDCAKKIAGTRVTFVFKKFFPDIHKIKVQGLSDNSQASAEITDDKGSLQL